MAIKASGVAYDEMTAEDVVLVDLDGGEVVHGERRPSTDTPTHLALYRAFDAIGGIVHTHSTWATAWAQAEREIPVLGTTHADLTADPIPVTRALTAEEIEDDYEGATGTVLVRGARRARAGRAAVRAGPRPRAVLLGPRSGRGGRERGHARGGGAAGAADAWCSIRRPGRCTRRCATSTTSASTDRARTTASDEPAEGRRGARPVTMPTV